VRDFIKTALEWARDDSALISIALSVVGFLVVLLQLRKTRTAAEAAKLATDRALQAISDTETISDIATIKERIKKVQVAVQGGRYEVALHESQFLRESLHQLRNRRGFDTDADKTEIQEIITFLRKIQDYFERHLQDPTFEVPARFINRGLFDQATKVSEWIEKMRFVRGGP